MSFFEKFNRWGYGGMAYATVLKTANKNSVYNFNLLRLLFSRSQASSF